ncbi:MAG: TetR/AcrR family transcriptional regulator [Oceanospirillales bacterium]|nr:TetR/AcrR family transcriptional regulator [Oceanospirillales bacterium]
MSWNPEHKARSRQRILTTAARLFARQGFDQVSIDQVMSEAGMTRGAFYAHFSSKSELYGEAILATAHAARDKHVQGPSATQQQLERIIGVYLSEEHLSGETLHCPLAFLVSDIAQRDDQVRDIWTRVFRGLVDIVGGNGEDYSHALERVVLMVGGVAIARALNDDDLSKQLLDTCRAAVLSERQATSGDNHTDRTDHDEGKPQKIA